MAKGTSLLAQWLEKSTACAGSQHTTESHSLASTKQVIKHSICPHKHTHRVSCPADAPHVERTLQHSYDSQNTPIFLARHHGKEADDPGSRGALCSSGAGRLRRGLQLRAGACLGVAVSGCGCGPARVARPALLHDGQDLRAGWAGMFSVMRGRAGGCAGYHSRRMKTHAGRAGLPICWKYTDYLASAGIRHIP